MQRRNPSNELTYLTNDSCSRKLFEHVRLNCVVRPIEDFCMPFKGSTHIYLDMQIYPLTVFLLLLVPLLYPSVFSFLNSCKFLMGNRKDNNPSSASESGII